MLIGYGHLRRFFEGIAWWKLEPHDDLLQHPPVPERSTQGNQPAAARPLPVLRENPMCLAEPGRQYVVYLPQGGRITLMLAEGNYRARWFNPRSGDFLSDSMTTAGGVWTSPPAPDAEDWVLLVESVSVGEAS